VLIVEDDLETCELIGLHFGRAGLSPFAAVNGAEAVRLARESQPDLIVLDLSLPDMDGLDVCRLLQRESQTQTIPILIVSGRATEMDRIVGLELGASDYVVKPFSPRELVLRAKNQLLRGRLEKNEFTGLRTDDLEISVPLRQVLVRGKAVELTPTEFKLLVELARNCGRAQPRERLQQRVLGYDESVKSRTIDTHVNRLQNKLGAAAHHIQTARFLGYVFSV
jgi:DNA-binding response OmpR family regulator